MNKGGCVSVQSVFPSKMLRVDRAYAEWLARRAARLGVSVPVLTRRLHASGKRRRVKKAAVAS